MAKCQMTAIKQHIDSGNYFVFVHTQTVPWKQHTIMPSIDHANTILTNSQIFCLFWVVWLIKQILKLHRFFFVNIWLQKQGLASVSVLLPTDFLLWCDFKKKTLRSIFRFNRQLLAFSLTHNWIWSFMWPCANSIIFFVIIKFTHGQIVTTEILPNKNEIFNSNFLNEILLAFNINII